MKTVVGDIFQVAREKASIIVVPVNTAHVIGNTLQMRAAQKWGEWALAYRISVPILGSVTYFADNGPTIAGVYIRRGIGKDTPTNHAALGQALSAIGADTRGGASRRVYIPWRLGCEQGRGDWATVLRIIQDVLPNAILVRPVNVPPLFVGDVLSLPGDIVPYRVVEYAYGGYTIASAFRKDLRNAEFAATNYLVASSVDRQMISYPLMRLLYTLHNALPVVTLEQVEMLVTIALSQGLAAARKRVGEWSENDDRGGFNQSSHL